MNLNDKSMKFYKYLVEKGLLHILEGSPEEIDEIHKEFQKENRKQYLKEYHKERIHRVIIFSKEEYALLKKGSKNHKLPFATYVRKCALKYQSRGFIIPDEEETMKICVLLKRYGVLLNQITYVVNSQKYINKETLIRVKGNFDSLEKELRGIIEKPIIIEDFILNLIYKDPSYINRINTIINTHKP
jgi:hypothetical protein